MQGKVEQIYSRTLKALKPNPTPRIGLFVRLSVRPSFLPTRKNPASEIHVSGSRIMDIRVEKVADAAPADLTAHTTTKTMQRKLE